MKKFLSLILAIALVCSLTAGALAAYPDSTVTFVCPWDAGGTSDLMTRKVAELFAKETGAKTTVENQGGAGGTIATTNVKNAKADGYTICQEAIGVFTLQPFTREVEYTIDDFIPVCPLSIEPILLLVNASSPVTSLEELLATGFVTYGFSGAGSLMELTQKKLFADAAVQSVGIPFDGDAPAVTDLLGNHIDCITAHPGNVKAYLESGDLRAIGIFSAERDSREAYKDIPTIKEQGYDVCMSVWKFMIVHKDTPADVVEAIKTILNKCVESEDYQKFCEQNSLLFKSMTSEEMLAQIKAEAEVNKALLGK